MASALSLAPTVEVFPCPNCGQTINTASAACSFCATPIDRAAAQVAVAETSRISAACSDASYLNVIGWGIPMFFGLAFLPFIGMAGALGLWFLRFAIPYMTGRWWLKYGSLRTADPDFARARRIAIVVSGIAVLMLADLLYIGASFHSR
jgi:hypothetical protein